MTTKTTTVAGAEYTLTGPFEMSANASGLPQDGYYAHAGPPSPYTTIIFDISPLRKDLNATTFFLNGAGHLVTIQNGTMFFANDVSPVPDDVSFDDSNVVISSDKSIANKLICGIDKDTCAMNCTAAGYDFNCLAEPTFQPDWRLTNAKAGSGPGCVTFSPVAWPS